jgi:hypothetical protein
VANPLTISTAARAISRIGFRTVVNDGTVYEAIGMSSNPTTDRSSGILIWRV